VTSYINEKNPPIKVIEGLKTEWEKKKVDPKKYNATIPKLICSFLTCHPASRLSSNDVKNSCAAQYPLL